MILQKLKALGLFFLLMTITHPLYAINGCLIGSSLYTSSNGSGSGITYYDNSPSLGASGYCLRAGTSTSSCQLRTPFLIFFWTYGATGLQGDYGPSNPPAYCPIDDYAGLLVLAVTGLGAAVIRKHFVF